jgi:hypothetical protein
MAEDTETAIEKRARAKVGRSDWYAKRYIAAANGVIVEGGVCPVKQRGKNAGEPNFRKMDPASIETVLVTDDPA